MIAKKFRLPINLFPKTARVIFRNKYFTLKLANNNLTPYNRLGIIISKRVFKSAVDRNRLRRRIFDFFRLRGDFFNAAEGKGKDLLIITNPAIIELAKTDLQKRLKEIYDYII